MSTPCAEHPSVGDVRNLRYSIKERRIQREREYQDEQPLSIREEGGKVFAGEFTYEKVTDQRAIKNIVAEQREDVEIGRRVKRDRQEQMSLEEIRQEQQKEGSWAHFQKDIGEMEGMRVAGHVLGYEHIDFDVKEHGYDDVFRNQNGNLVVVVESKFTNDATGIGSLDHPKVGRQASREWVVQRAQQMQDKASGFYTERNDELASEILANPDTVQRLVIHVHPTTLNVTISEGQPDGKWKQTMVLKPDIGLEEG